MRHKCIAAVLLSLLFVGPWAQGQEPPLAELGRFAGTWEKQFTIYKSEWFPEEQTKTGAQTGAWILDHHHFQETGRDSDGLEYMMIYSYDANAKTYRASMFQSNGNALQMTGSWDAESSTFTWTQAMADDIRLVATCTFTSTEQFEFRYNAKDQDGKELFRLEGTATRVEAKQD